MYKFFKVILLALKGFGKDHCALWATALTYTTVFATVPLLAVAFSIFHAFGGLRSLEELIRPYVLRVIVPGAQEKVITLIGNTIDSIDAGTIGIVGSGALLITAILLLCELEISLNHIWGIKSHRSFLPRLAIYWISITIGPLFLAIASLITVTLANSRVAQIIESYVDVDFLTLLPYFFIWVAFIGLYLFMPNTRVRFKSALLAGIIGGTLWQIAGWGFSLYTSRVVAYSAIYGSLGIIPIFLFWIFISWFLFFLGAEICFYHQNMAYYRNGVKEEEINHWERNFLTLKILFSLGRKFYRGENPSSLREISGETRIPGVLIESLLRPLIEKGVVVEIKEEERVYLLGRKLDSLRVREVIECFREGLESLPASTDDKEGEYIWQLMEKGDGAFNQEFGDLTLREVIEGFEKMNGRKDSQ
jgi:membrane protein